MSWRIKKTGLQARWPQTLLVFFSPILIIFGFRWMAYEPFVIPSESMLPNLLVHDHILVSKFSYGLKWPMGDGWLIRWSEPQRGDVVVFRFPEKRDVFYIKRLIGLPGDELFIQNGQITLNGKPWTITPIEEFEELRSETLDMNEYSYFLESPDPIRPGNGPHVIRIKSNSPQADKDGFKFKVPDGQYFVMGDNRDQSYDSRFWGAVPEGFLVGRAEKIWMSCQNTLDSAPFLCDPLQLRLYRFWKSID